MKRLFFYLFSFVLVTALLINYALNPLLETIFLKIYRDEILVPHRDFVKGFFYIMTEDLLAIQPSRWPAQIATWQHHFDYDIAVLPMDTDQFSAGELARLAKGLIVMQGDINIAGNRFYQRIGVTGSVLQIGGTTFTELYVDEIIEDMILWVAITLYISAPVLIWAYPFWRRLLRIRSAALTFGRGDLEKRVKMPRYSSLFSIAEAFNQMAERIQRLIEAHRRLNRAVSRKLRKPVSKIRSQLDLLSRETESSAPKDHIDAMGKQIDELDNLISKLLTYARYEGAWPQLPKKSYPLVPWIMEISDYMQTELADKHFRLHDQLSQPAMAVRFDPKHMGLAIANLLGNAAVYSRSRVELTVERRENFILLHIDDDGPGIDRKDRLGIFDPFTRLDVGCNRNSAGFGLGLAIVKGAIRWHSGRASVAASPLGGARFTLTWPGLAS